MWYGQGTGDRGGTLFPPQALWWFSCNLVDNIICLGGGGDGWLCTPGLAVRFKEKF